MVTQMWAGLWTLRSERGQDMVEYAVMLGFLAVLVIVSISWLAHEINVTLYERLTQNLISAWR